MALFFWKRPRRVTLYSRPGCHLCEDAKSHLLGLGRYYPILLTEIDIRSDPALVRRYDLYIPVIVIDGRIELSAPLVHRDVTRAIAGRG